MGMDFLLGWAIGSFITGMLMWQRNMAIAKALKEELKATQDHIDTLRQALFENNPTK